MISDVHQLVISKTNIFCVCFDQECLFDKKEEQVKISKTTVFDMLVSRKEKKIGKVNSSLFVGANFVFVVEKAAKAKENRI